MSALHKQQAQPHQLTAGNLSTSYSTVSEWTERFLCNAAMVRSKIRNLADVLEHSLGPDFEILEQQTRILTAPGEHYGSIMLAVDVKIKRTEKKEETLHLVAKLIPANEMLRIAFNIEVTFKKEAFAYLHSIPALVEFQKEYNVPEGRLLDMFPKCYGARITLDKDKDQVDEDAVILFENLKLQGFATDDRLIGFDLPSAKMIVSDLARFHAVPIALKLLKPDLFKEKISPSLVENTGLEQLPPEVGAAFHNAIMENAVTISELQPHLERLRKVVEHAKATAFDKRLPPNEPFATMCHMDYWVSNTMMLRDNSGKPIKAKMVDLQLMKYNSPVRDLVFFLFTSVINSVLDVHYEELVNHYYESLIENLKDFPIDTSKFSWDAFQDELNEVAPTEVYHVLIMLKPIFTEKGKVQNSLEDFQDSDWSRKDLLGPAHKAKLKDTVLALIKRGWI